MHYYSKKIIIYSSLPFHQKYPQQITISINTQSLPVKKP